MNKIVNIQAFAEGSGSSQRIFLKSHGDIHPKEVIKILKKHLSFGTNLVWAKIDGKIIFGKVRQSKLSGDKK